MKSEHNEALVERVAGPLVKTVTTHHCVGCPALATKDWSFEGENDDIDSGTSAHCTKADKHIDSYWHEGRKTPEWCPAFPAPDEAVPASGGLDLLPCPFCGNDAELAVDHDNSWIRHNGCQADLGSFENVSDAVAAWNRRAAEAASADVVSRAEVLRVIRRLGDQDADLALYGAEDNARAREYGDAAATRACCAIALMPSALASSTPAESAGAAPMTNGWKPGPEWRFAFGDLVQKTKGSKWRGPVNGFYITKNTPHGYSVESAYEEGSTQVWPDAALAPWDGVS